MAALPKKGCCLLKRRTTEHAQLLVVIGLRSSIVCRESAVTIGVTRIA